MQFKIINVGKLLLWSVFLLAFVLFFGACTQDNFRNPQDPQTTSELSKHLSVEEAKLLAEIFLQENAGSTENLRSSTNELYLAFQEPTLGAQTRATNSNDKSSALPAYYVFNVGEKGYVIVSAWDATIPILGYSDEGPFFTSEYAEEYPAEASNVLSFLDAYASSIDSIRLVTSVDNKLKQNRDVALRSSVSSLNTRAGDYIAPLLGDINWNQAPYYNAYCPSGTPVGCVATATSMIMKYWEYPEYGRGTHRSTSDGQVADYNHRLNWANMPAAPLRSRNDDVAHFCYDVAVGLNMMFGRNGSGTWQYYVPDLLTSHYYYKNTVQDIYRRDYSTAQWENIVYNELAQGRPVQYAGAGNGGGHSFVCDGYNRGYFHINWGWGGMSNGYFLLHALDPNSLGVGGGSGGFNYGQDIVIGIEPSQRPNPNNSEITQINITQYKQMLTFKGGNSVDVGNGYFAPMVVYIKATDCSYCDQTQPSIELLAKEYKNKVKFYSFDVNPNGNWEHWDFISNQLGIETVPRVLFVTKQGTYVLKDGVIANGLDAIGGAKIFRPYVEALLDEGGITPDPADNYCESMGRYARSTYIAQVSLSNVNNITQSNTGGYNYFSNQAVQLNAGKSYYLTLTPGSIYGNYPEYFKVWIDFDGDKIFSDNEVVAKFDTYNSNVAITKQISIPNNAKSGNSRMRVSMKWGSTPEACEIFDHGEVEDYLVNINPDPVDPTPQPINYPKSYGLNSTYAFIDKVELGKMTNDSNLGKNYVDYSSNSNYYVHSSAGNSITYSLTPGFGSYQTYWCYWRVWIDFNRNGSFETNEQVVSKYGWQAVNGWFSLPFTLEKGFYRIRVSMKMNEGYPHPSEIFNYGEVEDYSLYIN